MTEPRGTFDPDIRVRELRHLKPRLRDDIEISYDGYAEPPCYIIEDRLRSKFFRIGVPEYRFISMLDGGTSVEQVLAVTSRALGGDALDEREAAVIVGWLLESELAVPESGVREEQLGSRLQRRRAGNVLRRLNLLFVKIPLCNPDRVLDRALPWLGWMLGPAFCLVWLAVVASGVYQVSIHWDQFILDTTGVFALGNWLWLLLVWVLLKVVHEFFHGLMCKKYGGEVYEAGVILILFAPIGYVDATSSWRFSSRWQRIFTASAGMYVEFFIAAMAAWIWAHTQPGVANHLAFNTVLIASINTLLFNANPLMKFDGYYVFSDLVRIPNLYGEGQGYLKVFAKRWLLGIDARLPVRSSREHTLIGAYGVLSLIWRLFVVVTLLIVAAHLWHGAGILIAAVSAVVILGVPAVRFAGYLVHGNELEKPSLARFAVTGAAVFSVGLIVFGHVTWSRDLTAPAIVDYQHIYPVRAESSGFIDSVSVQTGQRVKRDQILLRLLNDQLPAQMRDVELELERLRLEQRKLLWEQKLALAQALHRKLEVMQQRLADLRYKAGRLLVRAPADGQVVSPIDGRVEGRFVHEGQELLQIAHGKARDVRVLISQETAEDFAAWIDRSVTVHINGRGSRPFIGRLVRTEPRALSAIRHPALSAPGGGSLPVMADPERGPDRHVLLEPRFEGLVSLTPPTDAGLRAGETGELVVTGTSRSLGRLWLELVGDWVRSLTQARING